MGIPYSKQINTAFDQVAPLVAAGFEVLQTTKNIAILLAAIQVLTVILLSLILLALFALLVILNPELERERKVLITPVIRWFTCELMPDCEPRSSFGAVLFLIMSGMVFAGGWAAYMHATNVKRKSQTSRSDLPDDGVGRDQSDKGAKKAQAEN